MIHKTHLELICLSVNLHFLAAIALPTSKDFKKLFTVFGLQLKFKRLLTISELAKGFSNTSRTIAASSSGVFESGLLL